MCVLVSVQLIILVDRASGQWTVIEHVLLDSHNLADFHLAFIPSHRQHGHSPLPQGRCLFNVVSVFVHVFWFVNAVFSIVKFDASVVHCIALVVDWME